jgi:hypothetical protein
MLVAGTVRERSRLVFKTSLAGVERCLAGIDVGLNASSPAEASICAGKTSCGSRLRYTAQSVRPRASAWRTLSAASETYLIRLNTCRLLETGLTPVYRRDISVGQLGDDVHRKTLL